MSMSSKILIDAVYPEETRVVIYEKDLIQEFDYETASKKQIKGYIYLAKVTRVEPALQAAFIEYTPGKHGFLPFSEIHPDYFQIPVSDRQKNEDIDIFEQDDSEHSDLTSEEIYNNEIILENKSDIDYDETYENIFENQYNKNNGNFIDDNIIQIENNPIVNNEYDDVYNNENEINISAQESSDIYKDYKIHEVIKRNQIILVQAIKEERGNKGASFTSYISLAGRYCVFMPNSTKEGGISRRITDSEERGRIKNIIDEFNIAEGSSIIVRTAGAEKNSKEIKKDYEYLLKLWNNIREYTMSSKAPAFIHAESDIIKRTIRDLYNETIDEIIIQGDQAYRLAKDFIKKIIPEYSSKLKQYRSKTPLFCKYQIEEQLAALYSPVAHLQSGGYIVINHTEALISIDVNSGKSTSERNVEETAFKTNCEAIVEITRQLRLRDLSGLIVIDFIDMTDSKNRKIIERNLKDFLKSDRAKIQVGHISEFGIVEMSRQRLRSNFLEANTISCSNCNGKGTIRTFESNSVMIIRTIESEIYKGDFESINIYARYDTIIYILNNKRNDIVAIESKYNTKLIFHNDSMASGESFSIERVRRSNIHKNQTVTKKTVTEQENDNSTTNKKLHSEKNKKNSSKREFDFFKDIQNNKIEDEIFDDSLKIHTNLPSRKMIKKKIVSNKKLFSAVPVENDRIVETSSVAESEISIEEVSIIVKERKKRINNYRKKRKKIKEDKSVGTESIIKGFIKKILE